MKKEDCKPGTWVRVTQPTSEQGKTFQILNVRRGQENDSTPYYELKGAEHPYMPKQMELVSRAEPATINNYQIY